MEEKVDAENRLYRRNDISGFRRIATKQDQSYGQRTLSKNFWKVSFLWYMRSAIKELQKNKTETKQKTQQKKGAVLYGTA